MSFLFSLPCSSDTFFMFRLKCHLSKASSDTSSQLEINCQFVLVGIPVALYLYLAILLIALLNLLYTLFPTVMTNLDSILKSRDITLPTKMHLVKAMVFPVVIYGCASWTIKKAED